MGCREVRQDIEGFVLGALPPAREAEIGAHLAECPDCRAAEEHCRLLLCEIKRTADKVTPEPDWERTVRSAVAAGIQAERRQSHVRRVFAVVGSMAALLLISLTLWSIADRTVNPPQIKTATKKDSAIGGGLVSERWRYESVRAAPGSVADGVIVQGASMYLLRDDEAVSCVVAIDTATGAPRWQSECPSLGYLAADRSRVFCLASGGSRTLDLVALDASDGKVLWRYSQGAPHRLQGACHPIPLEDDRVCWTIHSTIHMLDAKTGKPIWTRPIADEGPLSSAAVKGEDLYVVTGRGLHCLKADSGDESWRERFAEEMCGQAQPLIALAGKRIYFVQTRLGAAPKLFCMDLDTREVIWKRSVSGARFLLAAGEKIYVRGRRILALDSRTGETQWAYSAAGCNPLTLVDGLLYFVDTNKHGSLVALAQRTGRKAWELPDIRSCDAFTKIGNTGYIKTRDGIVHALVLCSAAQPGLEATANGR
ncbi:MAG: PQQ-binding-like beta-propeller repeat protein [Planctomycetes bacterium]|nr:PQQ-binding-like beta-propeller repeat protein [Planctomycetota bacterium]